MKNATSFDAELIVLEPWERKELKQRAGARAIRYEDVRRAKLVLMLARGDTYSTIMQRLDCNPTFISRWGKRFREHRLEGLYPLHKGRAPTVVTPKLEGRILSKVSQRPVDGSTHWSTRKLAGEVGVSHSTVARVLNRADLQPHRLERYMASTDPDFESKAADCIGLYVNPPQHAAIFCVDEKTAIQALDRRDRVLPLSPGRAERHGFEYYRHGTLSLYAALNTKTGEVMGKTAARHTSAEFVAFLSALVASQPRNKEIHIIADNLSAHKTKLVKEFLGSHPRVHMHYTPTYSSWLNQVEIWFSKIERDVIARGIFTSVRNLATTLMKYIRHYNKRAQPIKWKYTDVTNRIKTTTDSTDTGH